jgi:hypothetical protein
MSGFGAPIKNLRLVEEKKLSKRIKKTNRRGERVLFLEQDEDLSGELIKKLLKNFFEVEYKRFPFKVNRQWKITW